MIWVLIVGIIGGTLALAWSTGKIVKNLVKLAEISGLGRFFLTSILISAATTAPELIVSTTSAIRGLPEISFGNVVGSNIVNLALVVGIAAIWGKGILFTKDLEIKKIGWPLLITFLPFLLIIDKQLSRLEGLLLVMVYFGYIVGIFKKTQKEKGVIRLNDKRMLWIGIKIGVLVMILLLSGQIVVTLAKMAAEMANISPMFIGLFVVAVGTSLPELVFSIKSVTHHHKEMAMGNIIGSCVTNVTFILGMSALISPIEFENLLIPITPGIQYFFVLTTFLFFIRSKKKLERWEGVVLVLLFVYYTIVELIIG